MSSFSSNLISHLKNGSAANRSFVRINLNSHTLSLLKVLYREGYILSYKICLGGKSAVVYLRYYFNSSVLKYSRIYSKPSNQIFLRYVDLCRIESRRRSLFVSTNKGVISLLDCKKLRSGGVILFSI